MLFISRRRGDGWLALVFGAPDLVHGILDLQLVAPSARPDQLCLARQSDMPAASRSRLTHIPAGQARRVPPIPCRADHSSSPGPSQWTLSAVPQTCAKLGQPEMTMTRLIICIAAVLAVLAAATKRLGTARWG
jgi:hypothetical protein